MSSGRQPRLDRLNALVSEGRLDRDRIGGVNLVQRDEPLCINAKPFRHTAAIFGHGGAVVIRADADIQPAIETTRHAADPGKETVPDTNRQKCVERRGPDR